MNFRYTILNFIFILNNQKYLSAGTLLINNIFKRKVKAMCSVYWQKSRPDPGINNTVNHRLANMPPDWVYILLCRLNYIFILPERQIW